MSRRGEINLTLTFDGMCWCVSVNDECVIATNLAQLETRISNVVRDMPCFAAYDTIRVNLNCDTSMLPTWLRQYHAHYFNSTLTVKMA